MNVLIEYKPSHFLLVEKELKSAQESPVLVRWQYEDDFLSINPIGLGYRIIESNKPIEKVFDPTQGMRGKFVDGFDVVKKMTQKRLRELKSSTIPNAL